MKNIKTMKNLWMVAATFMAGMALAACSNEDALTPVEPELPQTYTLRIDATQGGDVMRGLSDEGTTVAATWESTDVVEVYKGDDKLGELTPADISADKTSCTLTGELDTAPTAGDNLTLKYNTNDFTNQDGTLTGTAKSIDKTANYQEATVTVSAVDGQKITTTAATFTPQFAIFKFTLVEKDDVSKKLSPTTFNIGTTLFGVLPITLPFEIPSASYTVNGEGVLYFAIPTTYTYSGLKISLSGLDYTFTFEYDGQNYTCSKSSLTFVAGNFYRVTMKMTKE